MSILAMGTYLGDFSEEDSKKYRESLEYGLLHGIHHIDTAINYRGMRSERDIGFVLDKLFKAGKIKREDIFISSKAGFIPGDGEIMLKPIDYLQEKFIASGLLKEEDIHINEGLRLTLHPRFYEYAINLSLDHMKLDYLDVHYLHEPELKKEMIGEEAFYKELQNLFLFYEEQVAQGKIRTYGLATWHSFALPEDHPRYICLEIVVEIAKSIKPDHNFKHIMLPVNKVMQEAATKKTQPIAGSYYTPLEAAKKLGLSVSTSRSINRGSNQDKSIGIIEHLEDNIKNPNIDIMILGMKQVAHMKENLACYKQVIESI